MRLQNNYQPVSEDTAVAYMILNPLAFSKTVYNEMVIFPSSTLALEGRLSASKVMLNAPEAIGFLARCVKPFWKLLSFNGNAETAWS